MTKLKNNNTFGNNAGLKKDESRDFIIDAIKKVGLVLCLPWEKAILENRMVAEISKKFRFIGYEYKLSTFRKLSRFIRNQSKINLVPVFGSIKEEIYQSSADRFANIILDYCGILNTFADEIKYVFDNDIVQVKGIVAFTLSNMGIQNATNINGVLNKMMPKKFFGATNMTDTEYAIASFVRGVINEKYEVEKIHGYRDMKENGNWGMPMTLVIIRRVK